MKNLMKRLSSGAAIVLGLFLVAAPVLADTGEMMGYGSVERSGGLNYGPGMMGAGWGAMSFVGLFWGLIWTINSILLGVLLWVLIKKNLKK